MIFDGKVALITGGAQGIGRTIGERLHKNGAQLAIVDINADAAKATAAELSASGARCVGYACNVAQSAEVDAMVDAVLKDFGKLDILINNAGITRDGLLVRMTDEAWNAVISINLTGAFYVLRAVARPMMKARSGAIVNIASVVALIGNPGQANYCAAKAGLIGLTKSAARELASRGVRVNAVAPGYIETAMTAKLNEEQRKAMLSTVPLGRAGTTQDVAGVVSFLASEEASYLTGQVISICGGMAMA
ncbi:MAG: 3-oxoacyl-[acyl-carrier-protein] reductase [Planctomycetota bacterium]|nr:3-oxoacyl-[acyl-carrier-protein] reductase [Planctomycetota bacterium]